MPKRYIRIDIEVNTEFQYSHSFAVIDNIKRILSEDMPYCKVIFSKDTPNKDSIDNRHK